MSKKSIKKISDKLAKVNDSCTISMLDNGFVIEVSGRDSNDDWNSAKIMCATIEELIVHIKEVSEMDKE
jgi:hypothetical protein